jgi:FMN reductase
VSQAKIVGIAGSTTSPSSTRKLVANAVTAVANRTGGSTSIIDIAEIGALSALSRADAAPALEAALREVETADLLVVGSPVYKGSYTGLFKHFIDLVDYSALIGTPVALLATGGSDRHALVIEHQVRPLFAFFQAQVLGTGIFLTAKDIVDGRITDDACQNRFDRMIAEAVAALRARQVGRTLVSAAA